jgi:chain length determinant protein (polysaccharide antigen chain regulator)
MQPPSQQQPDHNQSFNDEIDLADLVKSLWDGKWLVIGVTLVSVMLALVYLVLTPKTYIGSLEIAALPNAKADVYTELNATGFVAVDEQVLLKLFIEEVKSYNSIEHFIKTYGYIEQQGDETDQEFAFRLRRTAYNFSLVPPTPESAKNFQPNWVLNITTKNPDMANRIITDSLVLSNQTVNEQMARTFKRRSDEQSRLNKFAIQDLELNKQRALAQYEINNRSRLALLNEQAQIARSIGLSKGSLSPQSYVNSSTTVLSPVFTIEDEDGGVAKKKKKQYEPYVAPKIGNEAPLYLRGYVALEKEMIILESRKSHESFIPQLAAIEDLKLQLLQDKAAARADELLAITPIGTEQFSAAVYDLASVAYTSKTKSALVLALAVVLGGMLGIFVLLIRNALIKKDEAGLN